MDLNTKIIEAVRQQPALFGLHSSLEERCQVWKLLAEKLNIKEQHLRIRWYSLVQRYQNDVNFKYAPKMNFLPRKTEKPVQGGDWPEFIITEGDLNERQQDEEEYVFMELDEVENKRKEPKTKKSTPDKEISKSQTEIQKPSKALVTVRQDKVKAPSNMIIQRVETLNKNKDKPKDIKERPNIKKIQIASAKSTIEIEKKKLDKSLEPNADIKNENATKPKIFVIGKEESKKEEPKNLEEESRKEEPKKEEPKKEDPNKEESKKEESKRDQVKKEVSPSRCEDDIFGELVAAMLKRMEETKKKNVKKEIMNLLLT